MDIDRKSGGIEVGVGTCQRYNNELLEIKEASYALCMCVSVCEYFILVFSCVYRIWEMGNVRYEINDNCAKGLMQHGNVRAYKIVRRQKRGRFYMTFRIETTISSDENRAAVAAAKMKIHSLERLTTQGRV